MDQWKISVQHEKVILLELPATIYFLTFSEMQISSRELFS